MTNYGVAAHPYAYQAMDPVSHHESEAASHTPEPRGRRPFNEKKDHETKRGQPRCSHMTCDEGRLRQRCIKREISHLCHDEQRPPKIGGKQSSDVVPSDPARAHLWFNNASSSDHRMANECSFGRISVSLYQPETLGKEFSALTYAMVTPLCALLSYSSDFLETLDKMSFFTTSPAVTPSDMSTSAFSQATPYISNSASAAEAMSNPPAHPPEATAEEPAPPLLPSATKTERFLLTAADQESGTRDERLNHAPLSRWMDRNVSRQLKQQILQPLSVLRPKFRAVAQSLRDIDLVFIEEAFERLLLDYDRVFSTMGVPAWLWRRTGEIYKGNRGFSELVGVDGYMMRDAGRLCIYELTVEESAVDCWEVSLVFCNTAPAQYFTIMCGAAAANVDRVQSTRNICKQFPQP